MAVSRGCVNRCTFCNEYMNWDKYQFRSAVKVAEELAFQSELHPGIRYFWLTGSTINGNMTKLEELCDAIIAKGLKIKWHSQLSFRKEMTVSILLKMKKAGCQYLHYGLESADDYVLNLMNKPFDRKLAHTVLKNTRKAGIRFNINLIAGFPGEETMNFIHNLTFIRTYLNSNIAPSVAACQISKNSSLFKNPAGFGIAEIHSVHWRTTDMRNTLAIRQQRVKIIETLFSNRLLNPHNSNFKDFNLFDERLIDIYLDDKLNVFRKFGRMLHRFYAMNRFSPIRMIQNIIIILIIKLYQWSHLSFMLFYLWLPYIYISLEAMRKESIKTTNEEAAL